MGQQYLVSFSIYDNVLFFFSVWIFPHPSTFPCCGEPCLDICTIWPLAVCELSCFCFCSSCIDSPSCSWPQCLILLSQLVTWLILVFLSTPLNTVLSVVSNISSALSRLFSFGLKISEYTSQGFSMYIVLVLFFCFST